MAWQSHKNDKRGKSLGFSNMTVQSCEKLELLQRTRETQVDIIALIVEDILYDKDNPAQKTVRHPIPGIGHPISIYAPARRSQGRKEVPLWYLTYPNKCTGLVDKATGINVLAIPTRAHLTLLADPHPDKSCPSHHLYEKQLQLAIKRTASEEDVDCGRHGRLCVWRAAPAVSPNRARELATAGRLTRCLQLRPERATLSLKSRRLGLKARLADGLVWRTSSYSDNGHYFTLAASHFNASVYQIVYSNPLSLLYDPVYRVFLYKPLGHKRRYKETVRNTVWVKISSVANGGRGILIRGYNRLSQQAVHVGRLCAKKVVRPPGRSSARSQPSRPLFLGVGTCASARSSPPAGIF
ncbi:hypothetical protein DFH06DRAFT_1122845 [Mycena polygramma]|nr:hypothetical protein DFH06DRAFT_1122845 [Mycena polygramma]